jgi:hypothetical protein
MEGVSNKIWEFGLGLCLGWGIFRTSKEMRDEPGTQTGDSLMTIIGIGLGVLAENKNVVAKECWAVLTGTGWIF